MKKTATLLILAAAAAGLAGQAAVAGQNAPAAGQSAKPLPGRHTGLPHELEQLNLSDAQKQSIKAVFEAGRPAKDSRPQQDAQNREAARRALIQSKNFDEAAARRLIAEQQQRHAETELRHLKMQHEVFHILTPEQQKKFQALQQQRDARRAPPAPRGDVPPPPAE